MAFFIMWVLFLLAVIVSVPLVSWLENRKRLAALGPMPEPDEAGEADEPGEEGAVDEADEFGAPPADEGEPVLEAADDDQFAGFE